MNGESPTQRHSILTRHDDQRHFIVYFEFLTPEPIHGTVSYLHYMALSYGANLGQGRDGRDLMNRGVSEVAWTRSTVSPKR